MSSTSTRPPYSAVAVAEHYTPNYDAYALPPDAQVFQYLYLVKAISTAKFPVYLVNSLANSNTYAMKVFSAKGTRSMEFFLNEIRFSGLKHPNVIQILHYEQDKVPPVDKQAESTRIPYTIMEYAPYGDMFDFVQTNKFNIDDKLIRTFFRQLVDGVEYLHVKGIAHLDLKLENLLIGQDFMLKVADFDISYIIGDEKLYSRGTKNYRAPEMIKGTAQDLWAIDMYAIGVILFTLKTRGIFPYLEGQSIQGIDLLDLLYNDNKAFWKVHADIIGKRESFFDKHFKALFNGLINADPQARFKISDVKKSKWYRGSVYSKKDFQAKCKKLFAASESRR